MKRKAGEQTEVKMLLSETIRTWDFTAGARSQPEGEELSEIDWGGVGA